MVWRGSDWEEIFANGPFSAFFFNDFEIFNGPFLIILHRLLWAIFQVNGTMAHGPLPSQSLALASVRPSVCLGVCLSVGLSAKLVNTIETEQFQLGPSNLVHILLMTRG